MLDHISCSTVITCLLLIKPPKKKAQAYTYALLLSRLERKLLLADPEQAERRADLLVWEIVFEFTYF